MSEVNEFLNEIGLSPRDLDKPGHMGEMDALRAELDEINKHPVTIERLKDYIVKSKNLLIHEMSKVETVDRDWLSVICFVIPIVGIVRKWYQDQKRVRLEAQLKVFTMIEDMLTAPDRQRKLLQERLMALR